MASTFWAFVLGTRIAAFTGTMRILLVLVFGLASLVLPTAARADSSWIAGVELGALASTKQNGRRDVASLASLVVGAEWEHGNWELSVQAGIPVMPGLTAQVPLTARRFFGDYVYVLGTARPLFTLVGQCENNADLCPRKEQLDPELRSHGMLYGGFGSIGIGIGNRSKRWSPRFEASYILGYSAGIERSVDTETALSGFYQGGIASIGARF